MRNYYKCPECGALYQSLSNNMSVEKYCKKCNVEMIELSDYDEVTVEIDTAEIEDVADVDGFIIDDDIDILEVEVTDDFDILEVEAEEIEPHEESTAVLGENNSKIAGGGASIVSDVVAVVNEVKGDGADTEESSRSIADNMQDNQSVNGKEVNLLNDINNKLLDEFATEKNVKNRKGLNSLLSYFWQNSKVNKIIIFLFVIFFILLIIYLSNIIF